MLDRSSPAKAALNPITVEVIGSALASIVEEMGEALVRASHSTNIKERRDCSTALFDAAGATLCQAEHIPMHLGSFLEFVPYILRHYAPETLAPGDVFIGNDAYEGGGTHLPDIVLAEPIFEGERLIAWAINTAHHADFADRAHANIYQEGIRLPPVRLYRRGVLNEDLHRTFLLNCQVPEERVSDLRAQMAANRLGVTRMAELCRKYGTNVVLQAGQELMDYGERKMRAGILAIPDGTYEFSDVFDAECFEGAMPLSVRIAIAGDEMDLHFTSPPQIRAGINLVYSALLATVYYAVKTVVDPTILPNAGLARPIRVHAQKGTVLSCAHPAAVDGRVAIAQRVVDLVHGALARVVPAQVTAASNGSVTAAAFSGAKPDGSLWVYLETIGGGMGARHNKDGLDGVHVHMSNTSNLPLEALETEYPLTLIEYGLVDGSGGVGEFRGGMGLRRVYRAEADCRVAITGARFSTHPWGLAGGGAGGAGGFCVRGQPDRLVDGAGELFRGEILEIVTAGSGGFGDPARRAPDAVARDIRDGTITAEAAHAAYGPR